MALSWFTPRLRKKDISAVVAEVLETDKKSVENSAESLRPRVLRCCARFSTPSTSLPHTSNDPVKPDTTPTPATPRWLCLFNQEEDLDNGVTDGKSLEPLSPIPPHSPESQSSRAGTRGTSIPASGHTMQSYEQEKPLILVTSASGRQGLSVVRHLLARGAYRVRALVRNLKTEQALNIRNCGAELALGDLNDYDSLARACRGIYGIFSVQLYGKGVSWQQGIEQGKRVVTAAKEAGVRHFVYSTPDDAAEAPATTVSEQRGELMARAAVERFAISSGLSVTIVNTSLYYENFADSMHWSVTKDNVLVISLPMGTRPFYLFSAEDVGGIVSKIFEKPEEYTGKAIGVAGDFLSGPQLVRVFMNVTGKAARYEEVSYNALRSSSFPGTAERAEMFRFFEETPMQRDIVASRMIYPQLNTWRKWLRKSAFTGPPPRDKMQGS
mmetsp:Transcript_2907/g.4411  ORF Transcript_2907/g.4411 Transcript_2907/m.4411 type:complete len:440 (+) Transcript_2907:197-1516(+)|eukprot:CAMPEP_0184663560 /NCGR_PEP_ID=MMETSP0308-20130426/48678_1 /TAXON_ID=38269 /ORGANISM="Gloeochaete witrockiana, Strain SAG 46.84" /LENGTH=439 /DNA_ID=CAMNT_0027106371 /DNA_START=165 /DNA_END=1484 /DNA_ORIENTATION=-